MWGSSILQSTISLFSTKESRNSSKLKLTNYWAWMGIKFPFSRVQKKRNHEVRKRVPHCGVSHDASSRWREGFDFAFRPADSRGAFAVWSKDLHTQLSDSGRRHSGTSGFDPSLRSRLHRPNNFHHQLLTFSWNFLVLPSVICCPRYTKLTALTGQLSPLVRVLQKN